MKKVLLGLLLSAGMSGTAMASVKVNSGVNVNFKEIGNINQYSIVSCTYQYYIIKKKCNGSIERVNFMPVVGQCQTGMSEGAVKEIEIERVFEDCPKKKTTDVNEAI